MPIFRKMTDGDLDEIMTILTEQDLIYPSLLFDNFWVAADEGKILSVSRLEEFDKFSFLSCVGIKAGHEGRGLTTKLIKELLGRQTRDVYLYTIIPGFFERLGFGVVSAIGELPQRTRFSCDKCNLEACTCMKWSAQ